MPEIVFDDVTKIYPFQKITGIFGRREKEKIRKAQMQMPYLTNEGVIALQHCSVTIPDASFTVILGPSGSGKSTLLRLIAGLEKPSVGTLTFDGVDMYDVKPEDRDTAMVFQEYALYPNQTVYQNVAFPLEVKHMPREEVEQEVNKICSLIGLSDKLDRLPQDLSGGERQRVCIARAMVRKPAVLLLDEPLSNLDVQMKDSLKAELKRVHQQYRTTFVYVTHDQEDAMALADRIIILKDGIVQMSDTPETVYRMPANRFCAEFVQASSMNILEDIPVQSDGSLQIFGMRYEPQGAQKKKLQKLKKVCAGIRSSDIRIQKGGIPAPVEYCEMIEDKRIVHVRIEDREISVIEHVGDSAMPYLHGEEIGIIPDLGTLQLFDEDGERL